MTRTLVAFYSRTGVTRHVAHQLARRLGADLLQIRDVRSRDGTLGYMRSALEAMQGISPNIVRPAFDPANYGLVVLGTPVWASRVSSPMRRFLHDYADSLQRVAFFCTMAERGADGAFRDMRELVGRKADATCALYDHEILQERNLPSLDAFVAKLVTPRADMHVHRTPAAKDIHAHL